MRQKIIILTYYAFIPLLLFVFGCLSLFGYLNSSEYGILNLDVRGGSSDITTTNPDELLKGDTISGKFHSQYPNLGMVTVPFHNQNRGSDDLLEFRLMEVGESDWIYQADYKTDQFQPHQYFPFGFPTISDSDGRDYLFEIESLRGEAGKTVSLDMVEPVFVAKSTFSKDDFFKDPNKLLYFLTNKSLNIIRDKNTTRNTLFFFLPLIFYVIFLLSGRLSHHFLTTVTLTFVLYDIFLIKGKYDAVFLAVIFLWSLTSRRFKLESRISAVIAMCFLILTSLIVMLGYDAPAEKTASWAYLFLLATVLQQLYELKMKPKNLMSLKSFFAFNLNNHKHKYSH